MKRFYILLVLGLLTKWADFALKTAKTRSKTGLS